jgi:hypothetical protein
MLEIYTEKDPQNPTYVYTADIKDGTYKKLLGYSFTEAVDDLEGSFSFTIECEEVDKEGRTIFDVVPKRSIVKIYEGSKELPAFVGIIRRRRFGKTMTAQGIRKSVTFSGKSIISCVSEYMVSLDVRIQGVSDAMAKTKKLAAELAVSDLSIGDYIKTTWAYFNKVSEELNNKLNGITNTETADVISKFIGSKIEDIVEVSGKEQKIGYNIATTFFNQANNSIVDIWRNILPQKVYELYAFCDKAGKPKIMARQVPFGDNNPDNQNDDWKNLEIYLISPISLIAYELEQADEEVYTAFASYLIGSPMSREFYLAVNQNGEDELVGYNPDKVAVYGFRPLELTFNGYDRQGNRAAEMLGNLKERFGLLNKRAEYWYSRLDDMYSGAITICTNFNEPETNPRIGCREKFLGAEFYIEKAEHTWTFGGTPTIKLKISRGMIYDENGKIRPGQDGVIKNISKRFRELEQENA